MKNWSPPRLEETAQERCERYVLQMLVCDGAELNEARENLTAVLVGYDLDAGALAERAGKASNSVGDDLRRERWLLVKQTANVAAGTNKLTRTPPTKRGYRTA